MNEMTAFMGLGGSELIVILAVVLILFGARKIPEFAKGLGQGIKEFRKASREIQDELERATEETTPHQSASYQPPEPEPSVEEGAAGYPEGGAVEEPSSPEETPEKEPKKQ